MARQFFVSSVLGSTMLAIVFVGLFGCSPTVKEETKPEPKAAIEKMETSAEKTANQTVEETEEKIQVLEAQKKELESKKEKLESQLEAVETAKQKTLEEPKPSEPEGPGPADTPKEPKALDGPSLEKSSDNATASVATSEADEPVLTEEDVLEVIEEPKIDLGKPLVDNLDKFVPLLKNKAAWVNKEGKQVVMVGRVSQRNAPLEMFVCQKNTKEHESVLAVDTTAQAIHAALLLIGAEPGHPVQYQPEYKAATGTSIAIEVIWKDADGKIQKAKAQEWIKNVKTGKPMQHDWVFAGSGFWENETTAKRMYLAEQGDFICVSNFPTAMLDLPVKSSDKESALLFQAWEEHIPPLDTPVTIVLTPIETKEN